MCALLATVDLLHMGSSEEPLPGCRSLPITDRSAQAGLLSFVRRLPDSRTSEKELETVQVRQYEVSSCFPSNFTCCMCTHTPALFTRANPISPIGRLFFTFICGHLLFNHTGACLRVQGWHSFVRGAGLSLICSCRGL